MNMYNLSSGECAWFAHFSIEMENKIKEIGPSPTSVAKQIKKKGA